MQKNTSEQIYVRSPGRLFRLGILPKRANHHRLGKRSCRILPVPG